MTETKNVTALPTGSMIGLVGGGQLGMFFTQAAQRLGYKVGCFCNRDDEPAARFADEVICGDFLDADAIDRFSRLCQVVTYEFESIPARTLAAIHAHCPVMPSLEVIKTTQNRAFEKRFLRKQNIPTSDFEIVDSLESLRAGVAALGCDCVLKTSTDGYDGKGQWRIAADSSPETLSEIHEQMDGRHCTLEKLIELDFEVSMIVAGDQHGNVQTIGPITNRHENHILDVSWIESELPGAIVNQVSDLAKRVAKEFSLVGTLCVEFFISKTGEVLVNEIAPRPHNSGHLTIDSFSHSQFDLQALAVTGNRIPCPVQKTSAVMLNLLGDLWQTGEPNFEQAIEKVRDTCDCEARLHLYGKAQPRPGRKMGHVTILNSDLQAAKDGAEKFRGTLEAAVTP